MNKIIQNGMRLVMVLLLASSPLLFSCGDDEPDMLVGYYMDIQSTTNYKASEDDENQGTMSDHDDANVLYTTIVSMKRALRDAYPTPTHEGDDSGVITALDSIYHKYKSMYGHLERNTICTVKLYRTKMDGTIVKGSQAIKIYHFGSLPPTGSQDEI